MHTVKPSQFLRLPDGSSVLIKQKEEEAQVSQGFNYFCLHPKWPTFQLLSKANPFGGPWVDFPRKDLKVPTLRASNQVPAFTPTDQPAVWVPSLSHSKEKERGSTLYLTEYKSPGSPCVWTGCILDPAPSLGVWLAVLYGGLLFFISVGYGP